MNRVTPLKQAIKRKPCDGQVRYLPTSSFRPCAKAATYRVGKRHFCGTHANAAAIRILLMEAA